LGSILFLFAGAVIAQIALMKDASSGLQVELQSHPAVSYLEEGIPVKIVFKNTNDNPIRILNAFDQPRALPVFFRFNVRDENGKSVSLPKGGKISLSENSIKYIELKKWEIFELSVNLRDIIPADTVLKPGTYTVSVTYKNQYREDCFKGEIKGNTTQVSLNE
jgi:hypothetical protein